MKKLTLILAILFSLSVLAADNSNEKPIQHIKLADITSMEDAKYTFLEETIKIKNRKKLSLEEISQIHIITYTLEKSVAYFVENIEGRRQEQAKKIAVAVENIHLASENNRVEVLKKHLKEYFNLVDEFIFGF